MFCVICVFKIGCKLDDGDELYNGVIVSARWTKCKDWSICDICVYRGWLRIYDVKVLRYVWSVMCYVWI